MRTPERTTRSLPFSDAILLVPERYRDPKASRHLGRLSPVHIFREGNFTVVVAGNGQPSAVGFAKRRPDDPFDQDRADRIAVTRLYRSLGSWQD